MFVMFVCTAGLPMMYQGVSNTNGELFAAARGQPNELLQPELFLRTDSESRT